MRWVNLSRDRAELLTLCHAVAGVQTTISGESDKNERWRGSETWPVSLAMRTSLVQKAEKSSIALETWSASSRVGTNTRPEVQAVESDYEYSSVELLRTGADAQVTVKKSSYTLPLQDGRK